jgi:hypothetical protein
VSDSEQDDEFEAYLKRRTPIDKGMRPLDQLEPPPELDRIIIGKARKAIQGASPLNMYHAPKWALPVGLAATILISFAVLLDLGVRAKRNDASLQAARNETSAANHSQSPLRPEPLLVSQASSDRPAVTPPAAPGSSAAGSAAAGSAAAGYAAAAPLRATANSAEVEFTSERSRTRLARAEKAAKRARPEQEMVADATLQEVTPVAPSGSSAGQPGGAPPYLASASSARYGAFPSQPSPPSPASPSTASSISASSTSTSSTSGASTSDSSAPRTSEPAADKPTSVAPPPTPARSGSSSADRNPLDAATWLKRIEKLRGEGHVTEAEREMKRFREKYPDYPVPKADQ